VAFELTIMKSFLFILILIVASCINTSAQTDKIPSCPTITVTGPTAIPNPDKPITFTASLSEEAEKFNLQYNWTISGGEITEGQGTLAVKALRKNKITGIEKDQIVLLNRFSNKNLTQFYLVPTGANPPTCDDCVSAN
jgi:hypothetical protein